MKEPKGMLTWKIDNLSGLKEGFHFSEVFTVRELQWKLKLYRQGHSSEKGKRLSLCLCLNDSSKLCPGHKLYFECKLLIRDQAHGNHYEANFDIWLSALLIGGGFNGFMPLRTLNDASKGFLVNDTLIIEGKIILLAVVKDFS
ncbi:hypothetical protein L1049_012556 [Liquidambar formosana]|uniref:MATH domain-containing protein n=1 Tax=Liquidambar formosana TaxID=63359 RepID=A0AAP0N690_LIQFO